MGKIIAIANQKGGKTTVSVNLGVGLVREGQKVLLVDADPQGSMTACLGFVEPDDIGRTLATVMEELMDDTQIDPFDGILHHEEGVDLVGETTGGTVEGRGSQNPWSPGSYRTAGGSRVQNREIEDGGHLRLFTEKP